MVTTAYDNAILLLAIYKNIVCDLAQNALMILKQWCEAQSLSVSPHKINLLLVLFTKKRSGPYLGNSHELKRH